MNNINDYSAHMKAVTFDGELKLKEVGKPQPNETEVLIRVDLAGVCNTDHEIVRGYVPGFNGILGHEFIGTVVEAEDVSIMGKRCTAEINCACGSCSYCQNSMQRHCPNRTVLGIINRNGAFAEYITVPRENVILIPDAVPDHNAVFIEPLAAALEILDQVDIQASSRVLLLGDGKLGHMIGHVLASTGCDLTILGKHPHKLSHFSYPNVTTVLLENFKNDLFDVAIEATGNAGAFDMAVANVKPRGTIVLKSTYAGGLNFNPALVVVNELTIVGSRCGLFSKAVDFLLNQNISFENMVNAQYPLNQALEAFKHSNETDALKILIKMN